MSYDYDAMIARVLASGAITAGEAAIFGEILTTLRAPMPRKNAITQLDAAQNVAVNLGNNPALAGVQGSAVVNILNMSTAEVRFYTTDATKFYPVPAGAPVAGDFSLDGLFVVCPTAPLKLAVWAGKDS